MPIAAANAPGRPAWQHLLFFGAAVSLPLLVLSGGLLVLYGQNERARVEADAIERARSLTLSVDRELAGLLAAAEVLSVSRILQAGQFNEFDRQAREVKQKLGIEIVVRDREHKQLVNTRLPRGASLPATTDHESDDRVLATGRAEISNMFTGAVAGRPIFKANAPVIRDGEVVYFVNLSVPPERIRDVMLTAGIPQDWVGAVGDRNGTIVARTRMHEQFVGKPSAPGFVERTKAPQGIWRGRNVEGIDVAFAYSRSPVSGWVVGVGVPTHVLEQPARQAMIAAGGIAIFLIGMTLAGAWLFGRRISSPIVALAEAGQAIAAGKSVPAWSSPLREANAVHRALQTSLDERLAAEARIRASEQQLRRFIEHVPAAIAMFDRNMRHLAVSQRWRDEYKLSGELIGRSLYEVFPEVGEAWKAVHRRALAGAVERSDGEPFTRADGSVQWIKWEVRPWFAEMDEPAGVVISAEDITESRRLNERLAMKAHLIALSHEAMLVQLWSGEVIFWNKGCERLYGFTADEAVGRDIQALLQTHSFEPRSDIKAKLRSSGEWSGELIHTTKDGQTVIVDSRWQVMDGDLILQSDRDITQRKMDEQQIRLLNAEVGHRAKNLLAVVQSIARNTAAHCNPDEFVERLSERIAGLAANQDLLAKSEWQNVDLRDLARSHLINFVDIDGSRVRFAGPPLVVNAKAAQAIGMALHELATNCVKYGSLSHGGRVAISWSLQPAGANRVFTMEWREKDGPPIQVPSHKGFGYTVMVRMIAQALAGEATLDYPPTGVVWKLSAPADDVLDKASHSGGGGG